MSTQTTFAIVLEGDEADAVRALRWLLKRLGRTFAIRVVAVRIVGDATAPVTDGRNEGP